MTTVMATRKKPVRVVATLAKEQVYEFLHRLENRCDVQIVGQSKTPDGTKFVLESVKFPAKWRNKEVNPRFYEFSSEGFLPPDEWELDDE